MCETFVVYRMKVSAGETILKIVCCNVWKGGVGRREMEGVIQLRVFIGFARFLCFVGFCGFFSEVVNRTSGEEPCKSLRIHASGQQHVKNRGGFGPLSGRRGRKLVGLWFRARGRLGGAVRGLVPNGGWPPNVTQSKSPKNAAQGFDTEPEGFSWATGHENPKTSRNLCWAKPPWIKSVFCEQCTHKYSTYKVAQYDHISSREHAWLKSWKAQDCARPCVPQTIVIQLSCLILCRT